MLRDKNILVTGGEGFIGSNLVAHLSDNNNISIFDIKNGHDIKDIKALYEATKNKDIIFHLAGLISVDESMNKPPEYIENNFLGSCNVLRAAMKNNVKKIIFASSASVYGECLTKEDGYAIPKSNYGLLKYMVEKYMRNYGHGMDNVALRFFNVYGPGQKMNSGYSAVIPTFIDRALKGKDIMIYGGGTQTRDFVHVKDVVNACSLAAEKGKGVFNIGSGKPTSINELADIIIELTGSNSKKVYKGPKTGDIVTSLADISKARSHLNFEPSYDIRKGLESTIKWFKKNKV